GAACAGGGGAGDRLGSTGVVWHTSSGPNAIARRPTWRGGAMAASGLSANPKEYRRRLAEQDDAQIDAWAMELMRDVAKRPGVVRVVADVLRTARLSDREFERVFASGGGAPSTLGRDRGGSLIVPTISLYALVPGIRARVSDARARLVDYLVENFDELVYV